MNLSTLALIGVVIGAVIYGLLILFGLVAAGPFGFIGFIVLAFIAVLFFGVLRDRLNNKEDDYYEKNVKD